MRFVRVSGLAALAAGLVLGYGGALAASAEKGKRIYEYIYAKISDRIFLAPAPSE